MAFSKTLFTAALVATLASVAFADERPVAGTPCNPDECVVEGHCLTYWWCERELSDHKGTGKNGTWMTDACDSEAGADNLYWNPDHNGGSCDFWENLSQATKDLYNGDASCIAPHCEWRPEAECSSKYWYFHPQKNDGHEIQLECPTRPDGEQLVWDQARKGCHPCDSFTTVDGGNCCPTSVRR